MLFNPLRGESKIIDYFSILQTNPTTELALALGQLDDTGTVSSRDVVINGLATCVSAITKHHAFPPHGLIVHMIMSYKNTHHIARFLHSSKQAYIDFR